MNEKRIQQVLELEKQAYEVYNEALTEASKLPKEAEKDAQDLLDKSRKEAEVEARKIVTSGTAEEECAAILSEAEEKIKKIESLASNNHSRAVSYVLARVIGRE